MGQPVYYSSTLYAPAKLVIDDVAIKADGGILGQKIENKCNELYGKGYDIISILPLVKGGTYIDHGGYQIGGSGAGWSVTDGVIITAKLRSAEEESKIII